MVSKVLSIGGVEFDKWSKRQNKKIRIEFAESAVGGGRTATRLPQLGGFILRSLWFQMDINANPVGRVGANDGEGVVKILLRPGGGSGGSGDLSCLGADAKDFGERVGPLGSPRPDTLIAALSGRMNGQEEPVAPNRRTGFRPAPGNDERRQFLISTSPSGLIQCLNHRPYVFLTFGHRKIMLFKASGCVRHFI